jgi:exonuclease SbcC
MTNIAGLRVSGFRGLTSEVDLDLNANAVIIIGVNGQGKTSLLDAIMWCITGAIPRLVDERSLVSLYSSSGEARVELRLTEPSGEAFEIIRTTDGQSSAISLTDGRGKQRGVEAEAAIVQRLWPYALNAPSPRAALLSAYERSVYLQQDLVRDFVESEEAHERFAALSELLGAGRINELQRSVERSRLSWSRATNQVIEESNHLRSLVASREAQLASYSEGPSDIVPRQEWDLWWVRVMELVEGITVNGPVPNPTAGTSSAAVDDASRQLRAWLRSMTSRWEALEDTREAVSAERHRPVEDRAALMDRLEERRRQLADARSQIQTAETALRAMRESQASERLSGEELRTLATLAIRHLGERCPVCTQPYDAEATRRHLEQLINADAQPSGPEPDIPGMVRAASAEEEAVRALEGELREIDALRRSQERRLARLAQESESLGVSAIPDQAWEDRLADEEHRIQYLVSLGEELLAEVESLALSLARLGD